MSEFQILSNAEQLAAYIRSEIVRGRWKGLMPGVDSLSKELSINRNITVHALGILEREGVLIAQGSGKRRKISPNINKPSKSIHISILLYEQHDEHLPYIIELQHTIRAAGYTVSLAPLSLIEIKMDTKRLSRLTEAQSSDAWIVCRAEHKVLEWFHNQSTPVFALFGGLKDIPMAHTEPTKMQALNTAINHLIKLSHSRISLIVRQQERIPVPSSSAQSFLNTLETHGIKVGKFNLPDWEDSPIGLKKGLDSLFSITPPSALIVDEPYLFYATQLHLAAKGIVAPKDISMICIDPNPVFNWNIPSIAHIRWDPTPMLGRIMSWIENISQGIQDTRKISITAEYIHGDTVGQAPVET